MNWCVNIIMLYYCINLHTIRSILKIFDECIIKYNKRFKIGGDGTIFKINESKFGRKKI